MGVEVGAIPGKKRRQRRKPMMGALQADGHCEQSELHPTGDVWDEGRLHPSKSGLRGRGQTEACPRGQGLQPTSDRSGNGRAWFPLTERVLGKTARVLTARSGRCAGQEGARRHRLADCPPGGPVCVTVRGG